MFYQHLILEDINSSIAEYQQYNVLNSSRKRIQCHITWFPQPRKYYFPGHFQNMSMIKLPFSRTNYTRFKGNKSRYVQKTISYLFSVRSFGTAFSSTPQAVWSTHFYLNFNYHGISRPCTNTLFLLQSKSSSTCIIFIYILFCSK